MKRDKAENLDKVRVQMKLSVVRSDLVNEIVPKISLYANSQNKVTGPQSQKVIAAEKKALAEGFKE